MFHGIEAVQLSVTACHTFRGADDSRRVSRYLPSNLQQVRPRPCSDSLLGWILPTLRASEDEVILVAGVDAALYLKIIIFGETLQDRAQLNNQSFAASVHSSGTSLSVAVTLPDVQTCNTF